MIILHKMSCFNEKCPKLEEQFMMCQHQLHAASSAHGDMRLRLWAMRASDFLAGPLGQPLDRAAEAIPDQED